MRTKSMRTKRLTGAIALTLATITVAALSGCAPGNSTGSASTSVAPVSKDVAGAGKVTLTVWDQNTQGGINAAQQKLNSQFEAKYPNVTIKRVSHSFNDLKTTLKLALSGNNPPDVIQANQGYPDMGAFVSAGILENLNRYAAAYGWNSRFPKELIDLNRFTSNGKTWHTGDLYGIVDGAQMVGVFYNRPLLEKLGMSQPKTLSELESDMAGAKAKGVSPLAFGDLDKSSGIHIFGTIQDATAGDTAVRNLVYNSGGKWTDPSTVDAAKTLTDWVSKGYVSSGASGISPDAAIATFGKGGTLFLIQGTWNLGAPGFESDSTKVGFLVLNGGGSDKSATMGGTGLPWSITSKSKHPDVAAAYVDFLTDAHASQVLLDTGNFPALLPSGWKPKDGTLISDVAKSWTSVSDANGLIPYPDHATPSFFDTLSGGVQNLITGQQTPQTFTEALQKEYAAFQASR